LDCESGGEGVKEDVPTNEGGGWYDGEGFMDDGLYRMTLQKLKSLGHCMQIEL
jgi:hypothetical protein